jgi:hypothetical protein
MSKNFKNIALGLLALVLFVACSSETKDKVEIGRYVPVPPTDNMGAISVLDTKTGLLYSVYSKDSNIHFNKVNLTNPEFKTAKINLPLANSYKSKTYE